MGTFIFFTLVITIIVLYVEWVRNKQIEVAKKQEEERRERELQKENEHEEMMAKVKKQMQMMEVLRQAKLVGDKDTEADVLNGNYDGRLPEELSNGMYTSLYNNLTILNIAGINYRGNLSAYVGNFNGVLVPEPTNEYDENAIMIKCEDGKHLGYVPENMTDTVRDIAGEDFKRYRITGHIFEREDDSIMIDDDKPRRYFTGYINIVS